MGLSDKEAAERLKYMKEYIKEDGERKITEILSEGEREFQIAKETYKNAEKRKIDLEYERSFVGLQKQSIMYVSRAENERRMEILRRKYEHIMDIISEVQNRFSKLEIEAHKNIYQQILSALIVQGLCLMLEGEVVLRFRERDLELGQGAAERAGRRYSSIAGLPVRLTVDRSQFLDPSTFGGVQLLSKSGRVSIANDFRSRLAQVALKGQPFIRSMLYGRKPRKDHDKK